MGGKPNKRERVICGWCRMSVPIRWDSSLFKHKYAGRPCSGSGKDIVSQMVRHWEVEAAQEFIDNAMRRRSVLP